MKGYELAKLNMYTSVQGCFKKYESAWENDADFVQAVAKFNLAVQTLLNFTSIQKTNTTGYTEDKTLQRKVLQKKALFVAMQIRAFADDNDNLELFNSMHYTKSGFQLSLAKVLVFDAETIHTVAISLDEEDMTALGVTPAVLLNLLAELNSFKAKVNCPAEQRQIKKEATIAIKKQFKVVDKIIKNQLDNKMQRYKGLLFYTTYLIVRRIHDAIVRKRAMHCKIIDAQSGEILAGARFTTATADHHIKRKSSPKGQVMIQHLDEGNHTLKVSLAGYKPLDKIVKHVNGETTKVVIEMEKG